MALVRQVYPVFWLLKTLLPPAKPQKNAPHTPYLPVPARCTLIAKLSLIVFA
jgi:hypothetical protein